MDNLCPYCLTNPATSNDHVFPDFLGGSKTIRACKKCNDNFGSRFESSVSKTLTPIIVWLSFSGYKHKRRVVYKRAWVDETTGFEYDLDSDLNTYVTKPYFIKEDGKIKKGVVRSRHEGDRIIQSLRAKGLVNDVKINEEAQHGLRPPLENVGIHLGTEIRQLAVKMCLALGQLTVPEIPLGDRDCRSFLLDEKPTSSPVRFLYQAYPELDIICPPLAHAIYIESNSRLSQCYGIVRFFGNGFQFYVPLNNVYTTGEDFAFLAILDIITFDERFSPIDPLRLPIAPKFELLDDVKR